MFREQNNSARVSIFTPDWKFSIGWLAFGIFASIYRRRVHGLEAKIFGPERSFSVALTRFSRGCSHLPKAHACFESKNIQFGCKFSDKSIHQFVKIRTAATRRKQSCTL